MPYAGNEDAVPGNLLPKEAGAVSPMAAGFPSSTAGNMSPHALSASLSTSFANRPATLSRPESACR